MKCRAYKGSRLAASILNTEHSCSHTGSGLPEPYQELLSWLQAPVQSFKESLGFMLSMATKRADGNLETKVRMLLQQIT